MNTITQGGGIVFRQDEDEVTRYLLVRSSNGHHWVFPKGHVEEGENTEQTAVREVEEEAGVETVAVSFVGRSPHVRDGQSIIVEYYLLQYVRATGGGEGREVRWCTAGEALGLLSFEATREILRKGLGLNG